MGAAPPEATTPTRKRTITLPPPPLPWPRLLALLEEAGPELALVFWRALRKVGDWAARPPEERGLLFRFGGKRDAFERLGGACARAPGLVEALGTFAELIRAPAGMDAARLAGACTQVREWAEERSLIRLGMAFAEGAAAADPESPARANDAGRLCRRAAEDQRAASWYHRGYGLGVRCQDDAEIIRALIGYGNLMKDLGKHDEARKFLERATRRAVYTGRKRQAGEAQHDLLAVAAEVGTFAAAERHVRRALDLYPIHHPRIPALAHDWAFMLVRSRSYTPAIPLLDMVVHRATTPSLQCLFESTRARALAGARRKEQFEQAEERLKRLIGIHEEYAPALLVHLAEGARTFGQWDKAARYVGMALKAAQVRKDALLERDALLLQQDIASKIAASCEEPLNNAERIEALNRRIKVRLQKWNAPGSQEPGAVPEPTR